jgi:hypothetical protein
MDLRGLIMLCSVFVMDTGCAETYHVDDINQRHASYI